MCLGYVFFRSSGMAQSLAILRGLLDVQPGSLGGGRLFQLGLDQPDFWAAALSTAALLAVDAVLTCLALGRLAQREMGVQATSALQQLLDSWYPDDYLYHRYQNML